MHPSHDSGPSQENSCPAVASPAWVPNENLLISNSYKWLIFHYILCLHAVWLLGWDSFFKAMSKGNPFDQRVISWLPLLSFPSQTWAAGRILQLLCLTLKIISFSCQKLVLLIMLLLRSLENHGFHLTLSSEKWQKILIKKETRTGRKTAI